VKYNDAESLRPFARNAGSMELRLRLPYSLNVVLNSISTALTGDQRPATSDENPASRLPFFPYFRPELMIQVQSLRFSYTPQSTIAFPDFSLQKGNHFLLLGESGSGKTTLLHLLGGLLRHYSGSIKINDTELSTLNETGLDRFRGKHIGFIFQRNHLIQALTVEKNLLLAPYLAGLRPNEARVDEVLRSLGLHDKKRSRVTEISQGQAQRVAIARAVLNKPAILLADEPTSALDDRNCDRVIHLLMDAAQASESTLIVATHDQRLKEKIRNRIELITEAAK
jgi:ABC-type lipoprotein export system ATPase subunit